MTPRKNNDGLGTVYYAFSLLVMTIYTFGIINKPEVGLCACLIMGYGDGFASLIGQNIKSKEYKIGNTTKTVAGTLTMFLITFAILLTYVLVTGSNLGIIKALILTTIATGVEAISIKGTDNLTVPLITCLLLSLI